MWRLIAILLIACAMLCPAGTARATTTVQILGTDPPGSTITLGRNQTFYMHLHYASDKPVHIWAHAYFQGKAANAGTNTSDVYPAGSGEALGWFFLMSPDAQVDEVRIGAGDGSLDGTPEVARYAVQVSGSDQPGAARAEPEWVTRIKARDAATERAHHEQEMNAPVSAGDFVLFNGFMLAMFAIGLIGFAGPAWGLWRWRGMWRWAAAVPAAIMAYVLARLLIDTAVDPTSHNLWPFEILMFGALSVAIMLGLALIRKVTGVRP
jgi:hypothetical protein